MINACRHCKEREGVFCDSKYEYKGKVYKYYSCRECNATRLKKYYHTSSGKRVFKAIVARQYKVNREKVLARSKLNYAVKKGNITKPLSCSICKESESRIEGHHEDYRKPLDVIWVCSGCHADMVR